MDLFDHDGKLRGHILRGFDLNLYSGEKLALVGESGCGKSISALATVHLLPSNKMRITDGSINFNGTNLKTIEEKAWPGIRGKKISIIFQDPLAALNPVITVGEQVRESLDNSSIKNHSQNSSFHEVIRLFSELGLPDAERIFQQFPHQLSGGMCQRVCIAMALAASPSLLIADEPTTALDVTVQSQILQLLREEMDRKSFALLFITHNLRLVEGFCDRIAVIYGGQVVEEGKVSEVLQYPRHPYTECLLSFLPRKGPEITSNKILVGVVPKPEDDFVGCGFAPRCSRARPDCFQNFPLFQKTEKRGVRCFYPL